MKPVKFYVVPRVDIESVIQDAPLPADYLAEWEALRPGILNDTTQDIFAPNSRSEQQQWTHFKLFRQVSDPSNADVVVCQNWLELLYSCDLEKSFRLVIYHMLHNYPEKIIVFSWNHDCDSSMIREFCNLPFERCLILDYNTSAPWPGSVLLPFWNVRTALRFSRQRRYAAGFVGYVGSLKLRQRLGLSVLHKPGYYWSQTRLEEDKYLRLMSSFQFALCPRGGGLNSYRFYEAIQCGAVPVLFGDDASLPFPDLDYSKFSLRIPEQLAGDFGEIDRRLHEANWGMLVKELSATQRQFSLLGVQKEVHRRIRELIG